MTDQLPPLAPDPADKDRGHCVSCRAWAVDEEGTGKSECRRHAPQAILPLSLANGFKFLDPEDETFIPDEPLRRQPVWPVTRADQWCMDWLP